MSDPRQDAIEGLAWQAVTEIERHRPGDDFLREFAREMRRALATQLAARAALYDHGRGPLIAGPDPADVAQFDEFAHERAPSDPRQDAIEALAQANIVTLHISGRQAFQWATVIFDYLDAHPRAKAALAAWLYDDENPDQLTLAATPSAPSDEG